MERKDTSDGFYMGGGFDTGGITQVNYYLGGGFHWRQAVVTFVDVSVSPAVSRLAVQPHFLSSISFAGGEALFESRK